MKKFVSNPIYKSEKSNSKFKNLPRTGYVGRIFKIILIMTLILGVVGFFIFQSIYNRKITLSEALIIKEGDTLTNLYSLFDNDLDVKMFKLYLKNNHTTLNDVQEGVYNFDGVYTKQEIVDIIKAGPESIYYDYTILEGRSIYDIDAQLTQRGLIVQGDYIDYVTDPGVISKNVERYGFLSEANKIDGGLTTLEGFLYPDTYKIDYSKDPVWQIVYLQLINFNDKFWSQYEDEVLNYQSKLENLGYDGDFSFYDMVILASIVEKEERSSQNRPVVAGILLNKLYNEGIIYADITLCYGLQLTHNQCTPSVIVNNIGDKNNKYNTRQLGGLTPTPISNPTLSALLSVLNFEKTNYYYYLHDDQGNFYPSENYSEHLFKKSKYLNN